MNAEANMFKIKKWIRNTKLAGYQGREQQGTGGVALLTPFTFMNH